MKKLLSVLVILATLSLTGCGIFGSMKEDMESAVKLSRDFCTALSDDDMASAAKYLHPDSTPSVGELAEYVSDLERDCGIDFSHGVTFGISTNVRSSYYDSTYGGSVSEFTCRATVGGESVYLYFVIVNNDNGYGLYGFGAE